jgi:response regulator RpfG family c-di-GMP phosphodiesterase
LRRVEFSARLTIGRTPDVCESTQTVDKISASSGAGLGAVLAMVEPAVYGGRIGGDVSDPALRLHPVPLTHAMGGRILVVDDEPGIRDMLSAWLTNAGFECDAASDADGALEAADKRVPDVALLDIALPGKDGVWLARALRQQHTDTALIMVTGLQRFDAAVEGMRLGVLDYLLKPFTRGELFDALRSAIAWRDRNIRWRIEREELRGEIASRTAELADAFAALRSASAGALDALLVTLHTRNPEACAHARRVADMAWRLARAMGVEDPELSETVQGALLHDIGKVAMPDSLIYKPGKLSEDEIAIIRTHARVGHDIIAAVPALRGAAEVVLHSHEAWDGRGYPAGLAGPQIHIGSRITAVVDTFDAMTWGRCYRGAVSAHSAVAELQRCAGSQFDPAVVDAWLSLVNAPAATQAFSVRAFPRSSLS